MAPKGILAIIAKASGKKPMMGGHHDPDIGDGDGDEEMDVDSSEESDESHGDVLAEILGISDEDKPAFLEALKGVIREC